MGGRGESLVTRCMNTIEWKFGLIVWLLAVLPDHEQSSYICEHSFSR